MDDNYMIPNINLMSEIRTIVEENPKTYSKMLKSVGFKGRYPNRSYLWKYVIESTFELNDPLFEYSDKTRIFWAMNGIIDWNNDLVKCKICGNPIRNWNIAKISDGYKHTCSNKCERKCASTTYIDTCRYKYGVDNVFSSEAVLQTLKCKKDEIQHNREQTMLKKYKVKNYNNSQKANATKRAKYHLQKIPHNDEIRNDAVNLYYQFGEQSFNEFKTYRFPFTPISANAVIYEMSRLTTEQTKDQTPSKIIRSFHTSMYSARRRNMMSPIDYWEHFKNDENLTNGNWKDFFINRYVYGNTKDADIFRKTGILSPKLILGGLTITHRADTVSYLKPMLAKRLVSSYLADSSEVFCPFNGFSGIMLGTAYGCNKKFIGRDINEIEINESKSIVRYLNGLGYYADIDLGTADAISSSGKYDTLFCCPPYEDIEQWNFDGNGKCLDKCFSCDKWIDVCLEQYNCRKYLFVVDDKSIEKYRSNVVEYLKNSSHFGSNSELVVLIEK